MKVGVVGGSGYTGAELLRLCAGHPTFEVAWATGETQAGVAVSCLYPSLAATYPDMGFVPFEADLVGDVDVVFLALPHGQSQRLLRRLWPADALIVDLAADFRLRDPATYQRWYKEPHEAADLIGSFAYGLPERERAELAKTRAVACAGCYPTAAALGLGPLLDAGLVEPAGIVVDAVSGASGAGRAPKPATSFGTVNEDFCAYGLLDHRHTPEIEQSLGAQVLFTPHLAPMTRGILATCYARPTGPTSTAELLALLAGTYEQEPFVVVTERPPSTKATWGSNAAHLTARFDERTGWVVVLAAIDNLVKGAAGQAVQCANLALGLDEAAGLSAAGIYP